MSTAGAPDAAWTGGNDGEPALVPPPDTADAGPDPAADAPATPIGPPARGALREQMRKRAKSLEGLLPRTAGLRLRHLADMVGLTGVLTHEAEIAQADVGQALREYAGRGSDLTLHLSWWSRPGPGNFGDWLSPMLVAHVTDANILMHPVARATMRPHLVGLGSIGRFIRPSSIVVGTGLAATDVVLSRRAEYVSLRGPITAEVLRRSGGPGVTTFGDPGVLVSRLVPVQRGATNGRVAFVRHFSQVDAALQLAPDVDELSVQMSRRSDIEGFLRRLNEYDAVITSAMHVMIACQSYAIPCGLVTLEGHQENVHGSGVKYEDYALGAGVEVMNPRVIPLDLRAVDLRPLARDIRVGEATKDAVEGHLRTGVELTLAAGSRRGFRRRR